MTHHDQNAKDVKRVLDIIHALMEPDPPAGVLMLAAEAKLILKRLEAGR